MINAGLLSDIVYAPETVTVELPEPTYVPMSFRAIKSEANSKVYANLEKEANFASLVHQTIKKEWLEPKHKPTYTFTRDVTYGGAETEMKAGIIHVMQEKYQEVMTKSGINGTEILRFGYDDTTRVVNLHRNLPLNDALLLTKKLGAPARGIVHNKTTDHLQIRMVNDDEVETQVKALIDPELARVVGDQLMKATDEEGKRYVLKGIESRVKLV